MYFTSMGTTINKLAASARIGRRIAHYRKQAGFTQRVLSAELGLTQAMLACYETGKRNIPIGLLEPCAAVLGGHVTMFFEQPTGDALRRKPGPPSRLDRQVEAIRELPRGKQDAISTVLEMALQSHTASDS